MREEFRPAIEALQRDLADLERKASETKVTINKLCEVAGDPPMYPDVGSGKSATITAIRADTFYGKVLTTAAREYLEMRRAANLGPASTREIYEALLKGGVMFDTKSESNAITVVRTTLRKNSSIFHRLPSGEYGLRSWYDRIRRSKSESDSEGQNDGSDARQDSAPRQEPPESKAADDHEQSSAA